jgi:hypothetical protein
LKMWYRRHNRMHDQLENDTDIFMYKKGVQGQLRRYELHHHNEIPRIYKHKVPNQSAPPRSSCCMIARWRVSRICPHHMSPRIIMTSLWDGASTPKLLAVQTPTKFQQQSNFTDFNTNTNQSTHSKLNTNQNGRRNTKRPPQEGVQHGAAYARELPQGHVTFVFC